MNSLLAHAAGAIKAQRNACARCHDSSSSFPTAAPTRAHVSIAVKTCPPGTGRYNLRCAPCTAGCTSCDPDNSKYCLACDKGYALYEPYAQCGEGTPRSCTWLAWAAKRNSELRACDAAAARRTRPPTHLLPSPQPPTACSDILPREQLEQQRSLHRLRLGLPGLHGQHYVHDLLFRIGHRAAWRVVR